MAELRHTYTPLGDFNDYLRDTGSTVFAAESALIIARKRSILEAVSRLMDAWCMRSIRGSGFGPRLGTNRYGPVNGQSLYLGDDLLSITSVTAYDTPGGTGTTLTDETDFYAHTEDNWDAAPYRELTIHEASAAAFGSATRGNHVNGKWGVQDVRLTSTTTVASGLATDATAKTFVTSASPTIQVGHTLLIGTEQLYVTALSGTTATVERGVNGTAAAVHANSSAIDVYTYPTAVVETHSRLAMRRWKGRDAGADGSDGGGDASSTVPREGEDLILRRGLWQYAYRGAS